MNNSIRSVGTFPIKTDSLSKLQSYLLALLKQGNFKIDESRVSNDTLEIVAVRGNKFLHYIAEKILEHLPFSGLLGWAVRVQVSFSVIRKVDNENYILEVICEPMCNEIDEISNFFEQDGRPTILEAVGEDEKCRKAFQEFTHKLIKSRYLAS